MKMKAPLIVLCALLLVVASVMGTLAFLTSTTDVVKNTFTVGNVAIDLDEAKVDVYGDKKDGEKRVKENTYKLIPGHEYIKDPTIHVKAGSEVCYLFVSVSNDIAAIEATGDTTIAKQMENNRWKELTGETGVYYLEATFDAREKKEDIDVPVFATFTIAQNATLPEDTTDVTVEITAYAIQADGFDSASEAWAAAKAELG